MSVEKKYNSLREILRSLGKVIVAYSGGVDSTFLLKVCVDTLGPENVLACISAGPSLPQKQYEQAVRVAERLGAVVEATGASEMADVSFTANQADRCFHCKGHLLEELNRIAKQGGYDAVLVGANVDDEADYRPGHKAIAKYGAKTPLRDAGFTKEDIRKLSREMGLATADMPATPCLASRFQYGLEITNERLNQVEQAEEFLREFGLVEFRVRHHGELARIEVHPEDMDKVMKEPARVEIIDKLKSLGFKYVTMDMQGFRSGAMNETLGEKEKRTNSQSKQLDG